MIIKVAESLVVTGGKTLLLHDDDGVPLPGQIETELRTRMEDAPTFTVRFRVDGKRVRLEN